jgi:hypothetical protein
MADLDAAAEAAALEGPADDESEEEDEEDEEEAEEAESKFGPNADAITDFLNRLWLLTPEQVGRLVGGWQNVDRDDLRAAHESLQAAADEDPDWRDQVRHAQEQLSPWLNSGRIQETAGFLGAAGQGESRKMAGPALADAVAALVLGDVLERRHAETLYVPWFNLIGAPPLPTADAPTPAQSKAASKPVANTKGPSKGSAQPARSQAATPAAKSAIKSSKSPKSGGKSKSK